MSNLRLQLRLLVSVDRGLLARLQQLAHRRLPQHTHTMQRKASCSIDCCNSVARPIARCSAVGCSGTAVQSVVAALLPLWSDRSGDRRRACAALLREHSVATASARVSRAAAHAAKLSRTLALSTVQRCGAAAAIPKLTVTVRQSGSRMEWNGMALCAQGLPVGTHYSCVAALCAHCAVQPLRRCT